jgi:lipoprotein-anchoring transpeptidase ErfK/SrfK
MSMYKKLARAVAAALAGVMLTGSVAAAATYTAAPGDSLWLIARRHGISLRALLAVNPQIANPDRIAVGQVVNLPADAKPAIDWMAPSGGAYPVIKPGDKLWLDVDISDQRVYVKRGNATIYAMVISSGMEPTHATPRGTFYIEPERGDWFYSQKYQEGARYWVSFKGHGIYLFHSVVMDANQQVIESEARKLGAPASHGCLRMTVADARWIYEKIPTGTKVVIHN